MAEACPRCGRTFPAHVAVRALCAARWRGASFDGEQARANVGLAVADALGVNLREPGAVERFTQDVVVRAHRSRTDLNPSAPFEPRAEPEWWEFHVGFVTAVRAEDAERAARAAQQAVDRSRNFSRAEPVAATTWYC